MAPSKSPLHLMEGGFRGEVFIARETPRKKRAKINTGIFVLNFLGGTKSAI